MKTTLDWEQERSLTPARYTALASLPGAAFDRLTAPAARLFHTPSAQISLIGMHQALFQASFELGQRQTSCSASFCPYTLHGPDVVVVPNTHQDDHFADGPLGAGVSYPRCSAGALLIMLDGHVLSTPCAGQPTTTTAVRGGVRGLAKVGGPDRGCA